MVRSILRCAFFALFSVFLPLSAAVTITISPTAATVNQKATKSFVATVSGSTLKTVTWRVIGTGNGTITTAGVCTASAKAVTFKVRVTSKAETSKYVEATPLPFTNSFMPNDMVTAANRAFGPGAIKLEDGPFAKAPSYFPPAIPKATQSVKLMGKNHSCLKNSGTAKVILDQILSDYPEHTHAFPN